jgi:DNA (cytosine-5)-methyltransferase 1
MGSLFDGIGGFPLAVTRCGITPVWASEIVPDCIRITKRHFPNMKHLGDVTKINGAEIEPVDIITFGSPCQDLSIAGKRARLEGERSGLFMEAARIIKEMRNATNGVRPQYCVWENVPGAFSSNKGNDFKTVIEEISRIAEPGISIPRCPSTTGWRSAGAIMGDNWSLAWRTLDAQYWGVPQRRRRIFLVADFRGQRAGEILFKPESVSGNSAEGAAAREAIAGNAKNGIREAIGVDGHNQNLTGGIVNTLKDGRADNNHVGMVIENHPADSRVKLSSDGVVQTLSSRMGTGGGDIPLIINPIAVHQNQNGEVRAGKVANTLNTNGNASGRNAPLVFNKYRFAEYQKGVGTIRSNSSVTEAPLCVEKVAPTLDAHYYEKYECDQFVKQWGEFMSHYSARRLTPLECERLQGLPDGWTEYGHDGKKISDSARYRGLGNSLAIPCAEFVLSGIKEIGFNYWDRRG